VFRTRALISFARGMTCRSNSFGRFYRQEKNPWIPAGFWNSSSETISTTKNGGQRVITLDVKHVWRYCCRMAIQSFRCSDTQDLFNRIRVARFVNIETVARRKLEQLHMAAQIDDLRIPPGNQLKKLSGDRGEQYCVRINDQWRLCFVWRDGEAFEVEIVDYH